MGTLPILYAKSPNTKITMASKHLKFIILGLFIVMALGASASTTAVPKATVGTTMAPPRITTAPGKIVTVPANAPWYDTPDEIALVIVAFNFAMIVGVGPLLVLSYRQGQKNWK